MKFLHLADLHLGKRVNGFDLLEDQRFILEQVLGLCDDQGVEAVLLAGDIYDAPVPPAAATTLLDWFLTELAARGVTVPPEQEAVVRRVIHATADFDYAETLRFTPGAAARGAERIRVCPGWTLTPTRTMKSAYFCKSCSKFCMMVSFLHPKGKISPCPTV